jgi:hypothetical protein
MVNYQALWGVQNKEHTGVEQADSESVRMDRQTSHCVTNWNQQSDAIRHATITIQMQRTEFL